MSYPKPIESIPSYQHPDDANATSPITAAVAGEDAPAGLTNAASLPALVISHGAPTFAIEQSATTSALARIGQNLP